MTLMFILKAIAAVLGSTAVAYFMGKFIGRKSAEGITQAQQTMKYQVEKVLVDAAKGDDQAVMGDLREALDRKGKR